LDRANGGGFVGHVAVLRLDALAVKDDYCGRDRELRR
jgi:hypothetical protein